MSSLGNVRTCRGQINHLRIWQSDFQVDEIRERERKREKYDVIIVIIIIRIIESNQAERKANPCAMESQL